MCGAVDLWTVDDEHNSIDITVYAPRSSKIPNIQYSITRKRTIFQMKLWRSISVNIVIILRSICGLITKYTLQI